MLGASSEEVSDNILINSTVAQMRKEKMRSIEWNGQVLASGCWITSVFFYGITSTGDWLQLVAASCWMISNVAAVFSIRG